MSYAVSEVRKPDAAARFTRQTCQYSLRRFMVEGWKEVEGGRYKHNWHIDAMAEHLEAVSLGQIQRLLIIVPPQTTKSVLSGTYWPAWEWTFRPELRWLYTSNNAELAEEESLRCRRLIESEWYRQTFAIPWDLEDDKNTQAYYQNTYGGSRRALGFSAMFTGKKGNRIVVDDPNDAEKVYSEAERRRVNRKFDNAISDRLIDLVNDPIVIIGQRVHINDLIGHVDSQGGWYKLHIREEYIPDVPGRPAVNTFPVPFHYKGKKYRSDPRKKPGQMLRPKGFGQQQIFQRRRSNLQGYLAKHQGDPRSMEGKQFKASWFRQWRFDADLQHILLEDESGSYRVLPLGGFNVRERFGIVDPASSKKTAADFWVCSTFLITQRCDFVWLGCRRDKFLLPDQPRHLIEEYIRHKMMWVGVEEVMSNQFLGQAARKTNMIVRHLDPKGMDKLGRAVPAIVLAESGRIWLPNPHAAALTGFPLLDVLDEVTAFTGDEEQDLHDDIVDTLSYGVDHFNMVDTAGAPGALPGFIGAPRSTDWQLPPSGSVPTAPGGAPTAFPATGQPWRRGR